MSNTQTIQLIYTETTEGVSNTGYYMEFEKIDKDGEGVFGDYNFGVMVYAKHNSNTDFVIAAWDDASSDEITEFYNMIGTAVISSTDNNSSIASNSEINLTDDATELYKITNVYCYPYINAIGYPQYYGVVEIENTSNSNLRVKDCVFDLEDENGHLLHTEKYITACPEIIEPGEKGYFYNPLGSLLNNGVSSENGVILNPTITVEKTSSSLTHYAISDTSNSWGITGLPEFSGRVTNNTSTSASKVVVYALVADEKDRVIGISYTYVDDLGSGQTKSFSISTMGSISPEAENSKRYRIFATNKSAGW